MKKFKLFCLPHAGASANSYIGFKQFLPNYVEVIPIELAGRGKRFGETLYDDVDQAVNDIYKEINKHLNGIPYFIFGHSMGGILAYELTHKIYLSNLPKPEFVIFSGVNPPHRKIEHRRHLLSDESLKKEILLMGGTPNELIANNELFNIFLPIVRADLKIVEKYIHQNNRKIFNCDIIVLNGISDILTSNEEINEWENYTSENFTIVHFTGDHFFVQDCMREIADVILTKLE
ncbi:thioesterase II family protein [Bacillus thuringiensis]|uniref:thioesterase II family protein n=1 Tax=Bacillus thuringiensis TaxID=1428 RepID=UPI000BF55748|nr:thioesterase domain-containing protein [Bacillus thuringiensis]PEY73217.1 thioesterase [Bacillus thuringiensis]